MLVINYMSYSLISKFTSFALAGLFHELSRLYLMSYVLFTRVRTRKTTSKNAETERFACEIACNRILWILLIDGIYISIRATHFYLAVVEDHVAPDFHLSQAWYARYTIHTTIRMKLTKGQPAHSSRPADCPEQAMRIIFLRMWNYANFAGDRSLLRQLRQFIFLCAGVSPDSPTKFPPSSYLASFAYSKRIRK